MTRFAALLLLPCAVYCCFPFHHNSKDLRRCGSLFCSSLRTRAVSSARQHWIPAAWKTKGDGWRASGEMSGSYELNTVERLNCFLAVFRFQRQRMINSEIWARTKRQSRCSLFTVMAPQRPASLHRPVVRGLLWLSLCSLREWMLLFSISAHIQYPC